MTGAGSYVRGSGRLLLRQSLAKLQKLPAIVKVRESFVAQRVLNPILNAVIFSPEEADAVGVAAALDTNNGSSGNASPLAGTPFTVKDVIEVEGYPCTLGSKKLAASPQGKRYTQPREKSAPVVQALIDAGAVFVGKVNVPEMGMDVQTFNNMHGTTWNPWAFGHTPGGSSGGCAACVAAGISPLSVGSDLAGSLRIPASFCGVASLRPTPLRFSGEGHEPASYQSEENPISESSIVLGPIAQDVATLEAFMQVVTALNSPAHIEGSSPFIEAKLNDRPLSNNKNASVSAKRVLKLGLSTNFSTVNISRPQQELFEQVAATLEHSGRATVHIDAPNVDATAISQAHVELSKRYFTGQYSGPKDDEAMEAALSTRASTRAALEQYFESYDAFLHPVAPIAAYPHNPTQKSIEVRSWCFLRRYP